MSHQTCERCGGGYNTSDSVDHECPDEMAERRVAEATERIEWLEEQVAVLTKWAALCPSLVAPGPHVLTTHKVDCALCGAKRPVVQRETSDEDED